MKKIVVYIMRLCLEILYLFMKLFPTEENKVLFLSRQSNELTQDFMDTQKILRDKKPDVKIVTLCHRLEGAEGQGGSGLASFAATTLKSMYHMATSSVCVLDAYWPAVSILHHKKSLTVIQMWHALGKIKQSGYQTLGKASGRSADMAYLMKMHENYDYIIAGGKAWNPFYCKSFNTTEDKLINCGLPRIDHLLNTAEQNRSRVFEAYPEFSEKTVVLYAPTFRKNIELHWEKLADRLTAEEGTVLIVKGHPNQNLHSDNPRVYTCDDFKAVDLLSSCDYLVTDYSAIAIEGAVLSRPTYYFVYDYEEYREKNGMNIDLFEEMPGCVFRDADGLADAIVAGSYNYEALNEYRKKYLPENLGTSTEQIAKLITDNMRK